EVNLTVSLKLRDALENLGATVYMTRETADVDISNQERAKMMNDYGVDLVLRIHCDGADNRSKNGVALYCSRSNDIAGESYRACEAILPALCEATGAKDNGITQNDHYTGQNWSTVPCLMVECGFASNPEEDVLLNTEDYQWKLAEGLTQGIIDYITARDGRSGGE
ncbi:MAG: N-acetylmuramoyl-L-alanine amidase, partial [Selenomonadaceae bacterium]|nr:N-acetylmuramoyl-L-alanine amidase [Selenomonadaceae bacterium]